MAKPLLTVENLSYRVRANGASATLLNSLSFSLARGRVLGLVGPNGAGKSTLLKILARLLQPDRGQCALDARSFDTFSQRDFARQVAYLEQSPEVRWALRVDYVVSLAFINETRSSKSLDTKQRAQRMEQAMRRCDVWSLRHRLVTTLSGGERLRVMLARLLATQAPLLLLDEPLASLDPYHQLKVLDILRQHAAAGGTVCLALHDLNHALHACDELLLLDNGHKVAGGSPAEVLTPEHIRQVYGVEPQLHGSDKQRWIQMRLASDAESSN